MVFNFVSCSAPLCLPLCKGINYTMQLSAELLQITSSLKSMIIWLSLLLTNFSELTERLRMLIN